MLPVPGTVQPGDLWRHCGGLGKEILMPYPINQSWREQIELNWIGARVGLWDTALKFLSTGPRNDVTDHLGLTIDNSRQRGKTGVNKTEGNERNQLNKKIRLIYTNYPKEHNKTQKVGQKR